MLIINLATWARRQFWNTLGKTSKYDTCINTYHVPAARRWQRADIPSLDDCVISPWIWFAYYFIRYAFGDITNFVVDSVGEKKENERERQENEKASAADGVSDPGSKEKEVKASILGGVDGELIAKELEQWDKQFIKEVELELDDSMMITRTNSTTNSTSPK